VGELLTNPFRVGCPFRPDADRGGRGWRERRYPQRSTDDHRGHVPRAHRGIARGTSLATARLLARRGNPWCYWWRLGPGRVRGLGGSHVESTKGSVINALSGRYLASHDRHIVQ